MKPRQRERLLVAGALVCFAILAGDRVVLSSLTSLWKSQGEEIARLREELPRAEMLVERRQAVDDRWKEMRERALPKEPAAAENLLLTSVARWARTSGVQVDSIKPRWLSDKETGDRLEVRLSAKGDMGEITRFLYELEKDSAPVRLENVELRARDDSGASLILDARFSGIVLPEVES
jgi:Tfp pilus assembly protein PilO